MAIINWFLDGLILTLAVIAFAAPLMVAAEGFRFQRDRLAVWRERAPWLPPLVGLLHVGIILALALGVYYAGYRLMGFPPWMRWIVG